VSGVLLVFCLRNLPCKFLQNESGSSEPKIKRMLQSRKREKNSHLNIVQKKAMVTIVGNFILS